VTKKSNQKQNANGSSSNSNSASKKRKERVRKFVRTIRSAVHGRRGSKRTREAYQSYGCTALPTKVHRSRHGGSKISRTGTTWNYQAAAARRAQEERERLDKMKALREKRKLAMLKRKERIRLMWLKRREHAAHYLERRKTILKRQRLYQASIRSRRRSKRNPATPSLNARQQDMFLRASAESARKTNKKSALEKANAAALKRMRKASHRSGSASKRRTSKK